MNKYLYPQYSVLLVDDNEVVLKSIETMLHFSGINNTLTCKDSREVIKIIGDREIEVILLDLNMPHLSGEEMLTMLNQDFPDIPVIIVTGISDVNTAVKCMRAGALDYMVKPVEERRLVSGVTRAIELYELQRENSLLKSHILTEELEHPDAFSEIITNNKNMKAIFQYMEAIADSSKPVLITGESGVGKELVARAMHNLSKRKGSFIAVNVAGLDDNVFSDTLFGHAKGAFTGAEDVRRGLVEQASGGTLLLDEIGELSIASQIKLLRLIQEKEYYPLGSDNVKLSEDRIIVSTNQDLQKMQESGKFRKDLYYRLKIHHIHIPNLCERLDDLPILVEHFFNEAASNLGKKKPAYPKELFTLLSSYDFPGNIRELQSMIFNAVSINKSGRLSINDFKSSIFIDPSSINKKSKTVLQEGSPFLSFSETLPTLNQAANLLVTEALKRSNGNQSLAAKYLGISQQALSKRLKNIK